MSISRVLITDCGSTTTKALLFEKVDAVWRQRFRGEAPTTVEAPLADVTRGVINAVRELEELSTIKILKEGTPNSEEDTPFIIRTASQENNQSGIDLYLSTSSAGGGLQMVICGYVGDYSARSAEMAALGAGAIIMESFSADDRRFDYQKIARLRELKPDIILVAGGTDGGARAPLIDIAQMIVNAAPRPRFGATLKLPLIYAGNKDIAAEFKRITSDVAEVQKIKNVRAVIDREEIKEARDIIHELFLTHVMSHSPGYSKLLSWSPRAIIPTPTGVGIMIEEYSKSTKKSLLCVDIGGATTDIFTTKILSSGEVELNRSVSANYGMSYSVGNVLVEAGAEKIRKWLNSHISHNEISERLRNKMIRPTSIPHTEEELLIEQAVCREALSLSLKHHYSLIDKPLKKGGGLGVANIFSRTKTVRDQTYDIVLGTGGVLSHAPSRLDAAKMMIDGFGLWGVSLIAVDSIFMLPHLGVLALEDRQAAREIFDLDCLVKISYAIMPRLKYSLKSGRELLLIEHNQKEIARLSFGEFKLVGDRAFSGGKLKIIPLHAAVDVGTGYGKAYEIEADGTIHPIILDGRGKEI
jgi:uncharacterized protein (TIGR01319 family)